MTSSEQQVRRSSPEILRQPYLVLLADDSDDDMFFSTRALEGFPGLKVVWCAKDGEETIAYLSGTGEFGNREKHPWPDILVLDLKMPKKSGFEVLEWTRRKSQRPVIGVLTSSNDAGDQVSACDLGADLLQTKSPADGSLQRFFHWLENLAAEKGRAQA